MKYSDVSRISNYQPRAQGFSAAQLDLGRHSSIVRHYFETVDASCVYCRAPFAMPRFSKMSPCPSCGQVVVNEQQRQGAMPRARLAHDPGQPSQALSPKPLVLHRARGAVDEGTPPPSATQV